MPPIHLLLLSATGGEAHKIRHMLTDSEHVIHAGKTVIRGKLANCVCTLAVTGIGTVNAAHALTCQLEREKPDLVIQFGVGGAYVPTGLSIGAVVVATEEIYGDVGVMTPDGWKPADEIGVPLISGEPPYFNRFPLDPTIVAAAARVCGARTGPFVTVSQCTGVQALGDALHVRFGALCESMEGAAGAHICTLYNVPFLEARSVSNLVEDRNRSRWDIEGAANAAQEAVIKIVTCIDEILQG